MKRNDNYIVRKIAGETLLVPTGAAAREFSGLITLYLGASERSGGRPGPGEDDRRRV